MKRTLITPDLAVFPAAYHPLLTNAPVYDSSCSSVARVYYIDRDGGYYLKSAPYGTLAREARMGQYFFDELGLGPEVVDYTPAGTQDWLLCRRVPGEDATHADCLADPAWLSTTLGETLRALHELPTENCPGMGYLDSYLALAEQNYRTGHYDASHFPDSFGYRSADEAWGALSAGRHLLRADTLIHGDFCLPNVMFLGKRFSGFIDLGNSGVADRHIDLFWGAWSLGFNLGTDAWRDRFFDAYGREKVDEDVLRVVAAAEVFG